VAGNPILYYGSILVVAAMCAWLAIRGLGPERLDLAFKG
jgi:hypothetical protein